MSVADDIEARPETDLFRGLRELVAHAGTTLAVREALISISLAPLTPDERGQLDDLAARRQAELAAKNS